MNDEDFEKLKVELKRPIFTVEQANEMYNIVIEHISNHRLKLRAELKKMETKLGHGTGKVRGGKDEEAV